MLSAKKKDTIIVLAAGHSQVPIIKTAKKMGYNVLTIDRNPRAPGFSLADVSVVESTHDIDGIMRSLKEHEQDLNYKGILARSSGPPLYTAAAIAKRYGLPGLTQDLIRISTEKAALREFCMYNRIRFPNGLLSDGEVNLCAPLIVKPNKSLFGKRMIRIFHDDAYAAHIREAANLSLDGKVEVESFVTGIDCACLCRIHKGNASFITWFDELVGVDKEGFIRGLGASIPSVISDTQSSIEAEQIIQSVVHHFHAATGLLWVSFRIDMEGVPYLIEIHADLGGDLIDEELLPAAGSDFDFFQVAINIATNQTVITERISPKPTLLYYGEKHKDSFIFPNRKIIHSNNICKNLELFEEYVKASDPTISLPLHRNWLEKIRFKI